MQMNQNTDNDNILLSKMGYTLMFIIFVMYTVAFLVVYIKRLIMLAFLTMIAPLVAMTYPLDKMRDGNAQAFNMWLKEYVFNLLIQPVHLILYTMLVGSAIGWVQNNMIYAIVALGFIFQAEKIIRRFFGFESASTVGGASAVSGALAMAGMGALRRLAGGKGRKAGSGNGSGSNSENEIADRGADKGKGLNAMIRRINGRNQRGANASDSTNDQNSAQQGNSNVVTENIDGYGSATGRMTNSGILLTGADNYRTSTSRTQQPTIDLGQNDALPENNGRHRTWTDDDTRGAGQWIHDIYQGSALQRGVNTATKPARFVASKIGNGLNTVKDLAGKPIRKFVPKPIRSSIKAAAGTAWEGAKYVAPKAARTALKGSLAVGTGLVGAAAGLASDDDRNIVKYGATGLGAGYLAGAGIMSISDNVKDNVIPDTIESARSTYTEKLGGHDAEEARQNAAADKAARKDKDRRKMYAEAFNTRNKQELESILDKSQKFRENGVTNDKYIIKAMKKEGFGTEMDSDERILLAGLASQVGKDAKKREELGKRLHEKGIDGKKYTDAIKDMTHGEI